MAEMYDKVAQGNPRAGNLLVPVRRLNGKSTRKMLWHKGWVSGCNVVGFLIATSPSPSNASIKSNSTSPPYNGSDSNGQNDSVGSTITPLLGKSGKQETRKMMDHVISVREYGKADEHRKYGDKSLAMSNLAKLEFLALDISGQNYLSWVLDAEIYLAANGLGDTIQAGKETTVEQKAKTMIFLRHHIHENLTIEYIIVKDPLVLWNHLKDIHEHQKTVILPRARYDWVHLRFQDFKTARACRTPKHLVKLYQRSKKSKGKGVEVNLAYQNEKNDSFDIDNFDIDSLGVDNPGVPEDPNDITHLDNMDRVAQLIIDDEDICLVDSATTHTILKKEIYFSRLNLQESNVNTISGSAKLIKGYGKAHILLPGGTMFEIDNALFSPMSQRNLLSFKDIRQNGYHIETTNEGHNEYLHITNVILGKRKVLEKLPALSSGLYYTKINIVETNAIINKKLIDRENFIVWHGRLGHPGSLMMRKIRENSKGHSLRNHKVLEAKDITCVACSQGKLIIRPSPAKIRNESLNFLERIQGDICGPIHPPCGPFRYFMVLIDASTRWSHVCLLSSRNMSFARLLAQLIRLRAHFPDFPIKTIRLDNAGEFTSQTFNDYCMSIGISVEHSDDRDSSRGDKKQLGSEISWNELSLSHLDPRTKESANAPVKIDVPKEHSEISNESKAHLKCGRPISSKDKNPRKKKGACNQDGQVEVKETLEGSSIRTLDMTVQDEPQVPENEEISINYVIDVDDTFAYNVALEVMKNDEDHETKTVPKCKNRNDWPKWKDAIEAELKSP
ncbi:disease resistance CC-NBS-LRR class family protein [Tanacetum coccineum]